MKKARIFISFIGSRGSGKTTVADFLASNLRGKQIPVKRQHEGLSHGLSLRGILNAITLWKYFNWEIIKKIGFQGRRPIFKLSLYRLYLPLAFSKDLSELDNSASVLLYDSNFLRGLMQSFLSNEIKISEIRSFFESVIFPRLDNMVIVVVDTDPQVAVERWINRDKVKISEERMNAEVQNRRNLKYAIDQFVVELSKCKKCQVIRLEGEGDPQASVEYLSNVVEQYLGASRING